jgi:FkbM family methyltransferase
VTEPYFPNQPPATLDHETRLRSVTQSLPEPQRLELYSILSATAPSYTATNFQVHADAAVAVQNGDEIAFPRPVPMVKLSHIIFGYEEWLKRKYSLPGFVEVKAGDVVVDCGAYVGGFSLSAAKIAAEVHAFEPEHANALCARRNLERFRNARVNECGLYDRSTVMTLNLSASSVEHSLLQPDDGVITGTCSIEVKSLADYARENDIERFDFVKIEAEGVELEVFDGLHDMRPDRFAIDVSPERNGESPAEEFKKRLEGWGYEYRQRGHVLFARRIGPPSRSLVRDARIPRTIYSLWLQGLDAAPEIVRLNFDRWKSLNPGYSVEILDAASVVRSLADFPLPLSALPPQALSDVVRAYILSTRGGIWVDASVLPTRPLDEWLPEVITQSGFFAFERPAPDRPISSWFLAATAENQMLKSWWAAVQNFWSAPRTLVEGIPDDPVSSVSMQNGSYPYFWFHYLFQLLLERDPEFSAAWAKCTKLSADAPHILQGLLGENPQLEFEAIAEIALLAPVHKLNWRAQYPIELLRQLTG